MTEVKDLDGAKVLKQTKNDASQKLSVMFFEEKDGTVLEIPITALAVTQYEDETDVYVFMCDHEWTVQDDHRLASVEEAILWAEKNFDISEKDWL